MIEIARFASDAPGRSLLILGAIHGNEHCGTTAIRQLIAALNAKTITLKRGSLTLVPNCNPEAYALKRRYMEYNLNRNLRRHQSPMAYEHRLMNFLCPLLESCDVLLDIHSYTAGGPPFAVRGPEALKEKEEEFIRALGIETMIYDFTQVYAHCGKPISEETPIGTTDYARRFGAIGATIECGQHDDPESPVVAYQAIRNALAFCELTDDDIETSGKRFQRIQLRQVRYREPHYQFVQPWRHMEFLAKNTVIAHNGDGQTVIAPYDCFIVMPHLHCPVGEEWYYLGVDTPASTQKAQTELR